MSEVVLHSKLRELEEELRTERELRYRHDKELANLRIDVDDLDLQLQEALLAKEKEVEANKRLRQEYTDLKSKYDSLAYETEESNQVFRRQNQNVVSELSAHVEALSKSKSRYEKDNKTFLLEIEDLRSQHDSLTRSRSQAQALVKELEVKEVEHLQRIDELLNQLSEANEAKNRYSNENVTLTRRVEKLDFELTQISVTIKRITQELDDARLQLENETIYRASVETKLKNLQFDLNDANAQLDIANQERDDALRQASRAHEEANAARCQASKDIEAKNEELEDVKRRLNARYIEIQDQLTDISAKYSSSEKLRLKLQSEVDTLIADNDRQRKRADEAVRHEKQLESEVFEIRNRLSSTSAELEAALQANRNYSIELTKVKSLSEQLNEQLELSVKEKRRISEELETTNNHLTDSQTRLIDLERRAKQIEAERQQLSAQLEDVNDLLTAETSKYTNIVSVYERYRIEVEKKLLTKDEELDELRSQHRRQIEVLQETIEAAETRLKSEVSSIRKKYSLEIEDLKVRYDHAKRGLVEAENTAKRLQQSYKEVSDKLYEEQHAHDADREALIASEKRGASLRGEVEELKTLLDRSEKSRKTLELEIHDSEQKYAESQVQLNRAVAERKKFENDYLEAYDSLHEVRIELKSAEERARNASAAICKKDEEIRHERELALEIDASRKVLEQQLRETQLRVEEADEYARKEARRVAAKFEGRVAQLEADLDLERNRSNEYLKEVRRLEKRSKDLVTQVEEEQTKVLTLTDSHEKLQEKMRKYRGQIEGAEGQVAVNLSRCRRLQRELEDAEERAETMTRTFLRSNSLHRTENVDDNNYSSAVEEYTNAVTSSSTHRDRGQTPSYLRSSYLYSKPSNIDDYGTSYSRASSVSAWRPRFTTADLDSEDVPVKSSSSNRYSTYYGASFNNNNNKNWSSYGLTTSVLGSDSKALLQKQKYNYSKYRKAYNNEKRGDTTTFLNDDNGHHQVYSEDDEIFNSSNSFDLPKSKSSSYKNSELEEQLTLTPEGSITPENLD